VEEGVLEERDADLAQSVGDVEEISGREKIERSEKKILRISESFASHKGG